MYVQIDGLSESLNSLHPAFLDVKLFVSGKNAGELLPNECQKTF